MPASDKALQPAMIMPVMMRAMHTIAHEGRAVKPEAAEHTGQDEQDHKET